MIAIWRKLNCLKFMDLNQMITKRNSSLCKWLQLNLRGVITSRNSLVIFIVHWMSKEYKVISNTNLLLNQKRESIKLIRKYPFNIHNRRTIITMFYILIIKQIYQKPHLRIFNVFLRMIYNNKITTNQLQSFSL